MSIFNSIKRLFKHSAVYGIGHILTRFINFLLLPLYTNLFPREEYGVAGLMFTYTAILAIIYSYGLDVAFFRFYILKDDEPKRHQIFSTAFFMLLTSSVLFSGLLLTFSGSVADWIFTPQVHNLGVPLTLMIRLVAGILFFDSLGLLPFLVLRAEQRPVAFATFKLIHVLFNVAGNVVLIIILDMGLQGIFLANLIASGLTFFILMPITLSRVRMMFSRSALKELFSFGLPYIPATLAVVIMDTIDRPLLERLGTIEEVGLYNAGVKLGMFMALFVSAFRFAWHPFFLQTSKQENAKAIFQKVFTYVLLLCMIMFVILSVFIDEIARLGIAGYHLVGPEFWGGTSVVPLIMLSYVFYAAYLNFLIGIYLEKKTKLLPMITLAGMAGNLITNVTLIPVLGMMGAAWARLVAYVIMAVFLYTVARKLYPVSYEWGRVLKGAVVAALVFGIGHLPGIESSVWLKALVCLGMPAGLWLIGFFDAGEIRMMRSALVRFKR